MKIIVNLKEVVVIIVLAVAFLYRINGERVPWLFQCFISFLVVLMVIPFQKRIRIEKDVFDMFHFAKLFMMPYIVAAIGTIIMYLLQGNMRVYLSRPFSYLLQSIDIILVGISLALMFKERAINVIINAVVLSYFITLVMAVLNIGLEGFAAYLKNPMDNTYAVYFEMHDLCLSSGLILLALLFSFKIEHRVINMVLMFAIFFIGFKRIAFLAFAIAGIIGFVMKRMEEKKSVRIVCVVMAVIFISCYIYVFLIKSGLFFYFTTKYGLNMTGRENLFRYFDGSYQFSLTYFGKGFGFVGKEMTINANTSIARYYHTGSLTNLHNDILANYIDLGFIGSGVWLGYQLFVLPRMLYKEYGTRPLFVYTLLTVYAYITYSTDNTMHYFIFQLVFYLAMVNEITKAKNNHCVKTGEEILQGHY